jgi:hypothetical protein
MTTSTYFYPTVSSYGSLDVYVNLFLPSLHPSLSINLHLTCPIMIPSISMQEYSKTSLYKKRTLMKDN